MLLIFNYLYLLILFYLEKRINKLYIKRFIIVEHEVASPTLNKETFYGRLIKYDTGIRTKIAPIIP